MDLPGIVFFLAITCSIVMGQVVNVTYTSFIEENESAFLSMDSNIFGGALQVTQETANEKRGDMKNQSGRAIYNTPYKIWRGSRVASFNVTFLLNIKPESSPGGEGLTFFLTSNKDKPAESHGKWLGLFNSFTDGNSSNKMVAVEFDSRKNDGTNDPDGNHVGINENSINSKLFKSLDGENINLTAGFNTSAWIQYDGNNKSLLVYVANDSNTRPRNPVLSHPIDLSKILDEDAYFGFSASTGDQIQLNCILSWNLSIEPVPSTSGDSFNALLIVISVLATVLFIVAVGTTILFIRYRKSRAEAAVMANAFNNLPGHPREFKYKELKKVTHNFSDQFLLGRGGFGAVYKAILPNEKTVFAVKRMLNNSQQGKDEFISEIRIINQLRHRNLVPLLGWCFDSGHLMTVYEYMPNKSLEKHIYQGVLDWEQKHKIVSDVASALLYLHEECEQSIIHRDLKASNIMLDSNYTARLGDFGLARLIEHNRQSYALTDVAGTVGYIAPECLLTGRATVESDVFGFGAVALEVACGKPLRSGGQGPDLVDWVWKLYRENKLMDAVDTGLATPAIIPANVNEERINCLLMVGLACSNPNSKDRPTMREVKQILCKDMPPPRVPLFRPSLDWPNASSDDTDSSKRFACSPDVHGEGTKVEGHQRSLSDLDL